MGRHIWKAVSVVPLAGVVLALTSTPAHAAEYLMFTKDGRPGGSVKFTAAGDKVHLCDLQADGKRVKLRVMNVTKDPNQIEYTIDASGLQACADVDASMGQPFNLAEKHCFNFDIWLSDNGRRLQDSTNIAQWRNYNNDGAVPCPGVN